MREEPVPDPDPDEVRVRTTVSAVSPGTELLIYRGEAPDDLPADEEIDALDGDLSYPVRYGYCAVGEVDAVGGEVDPGMLGDRVFALNPHESHFTADPAALRRVPEGVDPETAALAANAETAVNLALDAAPRIGERVAVFGQGLVGLLTTAALARFPLDQLVAVEPVAERRALARRLGADLAVAPGAVDEYVDPGDGVGADVALELSGNPDALDAAIGVAAFDGRVVVGSWYGTKPAELDLGGRFHRSRVAVESSQVSTVAPELRGRWDADRRFETAWDLLDAVDVGTLASHRLPVERAAEAYERLDGDPDGVTALFTY